jgi:cell wall assembly regulator SMI1
LTREIELAGERLALTVSADGISVRPVGSRRPPHEVPWAAVVCHVTGHAAGGVPKPTAEEVTSAVELLKKGAPAKPETPPAPAAEKVTFASPASAPAGDVASLLARLEHWLNQHRRRFLEGLNPGASPAELDTLQAGLGREIPAELRQLLAWHNGQKADFSGHLERDWDLMSTARIVDAKKDLDGGQTASGWDRAWIPFLDDDAGDYVCLDTSLPGHAVREFWQGKTDAPVIGPSLAAWLEKFVAAVERGQYHEDPERGSFLPTGG